MKGGAPNKKAYEYVFDYFSEQILSGKLKLNDQIPTERYLSEQLGVSRNSAREALHVLEMMGLIECLQGSGNYVRCNSQEYMLKSVNLMMVLQGISNAEVFQMRRSYEANALSLAVDVATDSELETMRQILEEMDRPIPISESTRLDAAFHNTLVNASHNRLLIFYTALMSELLDRFIKDLRSTILLEEHRAQLLRQTHWDVYHALAERNKEAGLAALERHFDIDQAYIAELQKDG